MFISHSIQKIKNRLHFLRSKLVHIFRILLPPFAVEFAHSITLKSLKVKERIFLVEYNLYMGKIYNQ